MVSNLIALIIAFLTKYEGSAVVINAVDPLRTVWNEIIRQFPDAPE